MGGGWDKEGDGNKRLLLYAEKRLGEPVQKITKLRGKVWLVETKTKKWILKEYPGIERLKRQMLLTTTLLESGFSHICRFLPADDDGDCIFEQTCFGIMEYIEPHPDAFAYHTEQDILSAFRLLKAYHRATGRFPLSAKIEFPLFFQLRKWRNRYREFLENKGEIMHYMPAFYFKTYESWAHASLKKLGEKEPIFTRPPYCITHGDVAHHNFLRGKDGKLYLIDFDLARLAPAWTDDLQFCNRILPSISWSLSKLCNLGIMMDAPDRETILEALLYPADVLREWNRFITCGENEKEQLWPHLSSITFGQFEERGRFVLEVEKQLRA